jgi:hypothetical protein
MALPLAQVVDRVACSLSSQKRPPPRAHLCARVRPSPVLSAPPNKGNTLQAVAVPGTRVPHPIEDGETRQVGPRYGPGTQVISRSSTLSCALGPETRCRRLRPSATRTARSLLLPRHALPLWAKLPLQWTRRTKEAWSRSTRPAAFCNAAPPKPWSPTSAPTPHRIAPVPAADRRFRALQRTALRQTQAGRRA